jgi:hypothetical protein
VSDFLFVACSTTTTATTTTKESTLLNKLLNKTERGGFAVGNTSNACTKGLWVHEEILVQKDELGEYDVIVLDSEGFDSQVHITGRQESRAE